MLSCIHTDTQYCCFDPNQTTAERGLTITKVVAFALAAIALAATLGLYTQGFYIAGHCCIGVSAASCILLSILDRCTDHSAKTNESQSKQVREKLKLNHEAPDHLIIKRAVNGTMGAPTNQLLEDIRHNPNKLFNPVIEHLGKNPIPFVDAFRNKDLCNEDFDLVLSGEKIIQLLSLFEEHNSSYLLSQDCHNRWIILVRIEKKMNEEEKFSSGILIYHLDLNIKSSNAWTTRFVFKEDVQDGNMQVTSFESWLTQPQGLIEFLDPEQQPMVQPNGYLLNFLDKKVTLYTDTFESRVWDPQKNYPQENSRQEIKSSMRTLVCKASQGKMVTDPSRL